MIGLLRVACLLIGTATAGLCGPTGIGLALLHKSVDGRTSPIPGQSYPTTFVTGMPSAVKPFRTATRTWNSAT